MAEVIRKTPRIPVDCGMEATALLAPLMPSMHGRVDNGAVMKKDSANRKAYQKPTLVKAALLSAVTAGTISGPAHG